MTIAEYARYDALGLAELVRDKEVTAGELVEAAIARIERHNGTLNAVVFKAYDEARRVAAGDLPDGPFRGVPFLIKDLGVGVAGWPRTNGSRFTRDWVDETDTGLVGRFREAGLVFLGKTNTPEYGITGTTEGALLGPCRSPWNPEHISGGSSGGSASAVGAGIVPIAHASDGLGSIRIPAACCGLVGLKVTRHRNPSPPDLDPHALAVEHIVSRTVRDTAAMLDHSGRPDPLAPYPSPPRPASYLAETKKAPGKLTIAFSSATPSGAPIDPEVRAALEAVAALLERLGHRVEERDLPVDQRDLYRANRAPSAANFARGMARRVERNGRNPEPDELEPLTWANWKYGQRITGEEVIAGLEQQRALNRQILAFFEPIDVFLTPVMGMPAPKVGWIDPVNLEPREVNRRQAQAFPFTPPFNFTGQPSLSLPLATSKSGLPIAMMFTARYADEATLIRLAAQLEQEMPWKDRRPPIWD